MFSAPGWRARELEEVHASLLQCPPNTDTLELKSDLEVNEERIPLGANEEYTAEEVAFVMQLFQNGTMDCGDGSGIEIEEDIEEDVYVLERQSRPGTEHGKGGRNYAGTPAQRRKKIEKTIPDKMMRVLLAICGGTDDEFYNTIDKYLAPWCGIKNEGGPERNERMKAFQRIVRGSLMPNKGKSEPHEVLDRCPILAVSTKLTHSQTGARGANSMDKHAVMTWLSREGYLLCSCVGITSFRMKMDELTLCVDEEQRDQAGDFVEHGPITAGSDAMEVNEPHMSESHISIPVGSRQYTHTAAEEQTVTFIDTAQTHVYEMRASTQESAAPEARDTDHLPVAHLLTSTGQRTVCVHVVGMHKFVRAVSNLYKCDDRKTARALADLYAIKCKVSFATFTDDCPSARTMHDGKVVVTCNLLRGTKWAYFAPVRVVRNGSFFVCAFCDTTHRGGCEHTRIAVENREDIETPEEVGEDDYSKESEEHISHLPLSPVNCSRSIRVDKDVTMAAFRGEVYQIHAPCTCQKCGAVRDVKTRESRRGVLTCTAGPCEMEVEWFRCTAEGCAALIAPEGRENCVLLESMTSGATHCLLRRELTGVALSNGTISGRLLQFHSQSIGMQMCGLLPKMPTCRSVKTLREMCSIMLRLITKNPDPSLFSCHTCESDEKGMNAVCVDGIQQGYKRRLQLKIKNISQSCEPLPNRFGNRVPRGGGPQRRPMNSLTRREGVPRVLMAAVKGEEMVCTKLNAEDVVHCIRIISQSLLPTALFPNSICGKGTNDYYNDMGEKTWMDALRGLTTAFFDEHTLLYRLLKPLHSFITFTVPRDPLYLQSKGAFVTIVRNYDSEERRDSTAAIGEIEGETELGTRTMTAVDVVAEEWKKLEEDYMCSIVRSGKCWAKAFRNGMTDYDADRRQEIFRMFNILVQGPLTQFIRRREISSMSELGRMCLKEDVRETISFLHSRSHNRKGDRSGETVLISNRFLRAATFTIAVMERESEGMRKAAIRKARLSLGEVFISCAECTELFYEYYDREGKKADTKHSCLQYYQDWNSSDVTELKTKMKSRHDDEIQLHNKIQENDAMRCAVVSGNYYPGREQVRPLPFNSEQCSFDNSAKLSPCSKSFYQKQKQYTPGAMTLSCSCANPVVLGFKVLFRDEGPKVVLDMILSRFPRLPRHIVYDFACGLYSSAAHTLWWALENTVIVSDKFHAGNHNGCSPSFLPTAHTGLDLSNSVAHEQRNRGIKLLSSSLRNSGCHLYVSMLAFHTIINNIRARAKKTMVFENRPRLVSDSDIEWCYFDCLGMNCNCCPTGQS